MSTFADYVVVGAGIAGCVIAHRLRQNGNSVILLEAGPDPSENPNIVTLLGSFGLVGSNLDYAYKSQPQLQTYNRSHTVSAGKCLGGSGTINNGGWLRGDAGDYDTWGDLVKDSRWNYQGLLPWLRKTETYFDPKQNPEKHGHDGPMFVTTVSASDPDRCYPLREPIREAWAELGVGFNPDQDSGSVAGIAEFHENAKGGERKPVYEAYSLDGVTVLTNAVASRVSFENGTASGVELIDGRVFNAAREVIICAGAIRTPQLLMLSGIGSSAELARHGISLVSNLPGVGQNLHDHFAMYLAYKLKNPERGLSLPRFQHPAFFKGLPADWLVNELARPDKLTELLEKEAKDDSFAESLLRHQRPVCESFTFYAPGSIPGIPFDGSHIASSTLLTTPTSRGTVSISSSCPTDPPVINQNFLTTEFDRAALVYGVRRAVTAMLGTKALGSFVESETAPSGDEPLFANLTPLTAGTSDEILLERIRKTGSPHYHAGGTACMGSVVDVEGRVKGVKGLRIADASLIPVPMAGHPQATVYALAEQIAGMIVGDT